MAKVKLGLLKKQGNTMKESLRALKTNLQFSGDDIKIISFTSALPNEGKSTVVMDLARSLTESGKSVLVVDSDMRKSVLVGRLRAEPLDTDEIVGLSHYLTGQRTAGDIMYATNVPNLFMIFAGHSVPNPTEILEKKRFENLITFAREHFDYVLIDCAPLGAAIDAALVSKFCDGTIIVVAQDHANTRMIQGIKRQLEVADVRILGVVLNKVKMKKNSYYGSYYGNYYGSYYGND